MLVFFSISRDLTYTCRLLDALADAASTTDPGSASLIRQFRDKQYHRTGFTIGGVCPRAVARASIEVSRQALRSIDLRSHEASHPRIGVVDHVSMHPLGEGGEEFARKAGLIIATALGEEGVPVLLYGDLKNGRRLAEVRVEREPNLVQWGTRAVEIGKVFSLNCGLLPKFCSTVCCMLGEDHPGCITKQGVVLFPGHMPTSLGAVSNNRNTLHSYYYRGARFCWSIHVSARRGGHPTWN